MNEVVRQVLALTAAVAARERKIRDLTERPARAVPAPPADDRHPPRCRCGTCTEPDPAEEPA